MPQLVKSVKLPYHIPASVAAVFLLTGISGSLPDVLPTIGSTGSRQGFDVPVCGLTHVGGIPNTLLSRSVALRSGIGEFAMPTSSQSIKAQAYLEQGMGYLHGYALVEAARSFNEALRHDSVMVMAHVGLSRVFMELDDTEQARAAAYRAKSIAAASKNATEREKLHVDLRFAQLKAVDSLANQTLLNEYRQALHKAVRRFPHDAELWLMAGNAYERFANGRGQGSSPASIAIYEKVLAMYPHHPSAHHFLIHAYEGMTDYQQALEHGKAYAGQAPNLAHSLHMYAHDLMKTGNVDDAITQMKRADAIERSLYKSDGYEAMYDWHHIHNISLLALGFQYQGRMREAEVLVRERYDTERPINPAQTFYNKMGYPAMLIQQNRDADAKPIVADLIDAKTPGEQSIGHYLMGMILLKKGQLPAARQSLRAAQAALAEAKRTEKGDWLSAWLEPHPAFLSALISLSDPSDREKGLAEVRAFQAKAREQFGPDPWAEALFQLETITQLAWQVNLPEFAIESTRRLAEHDPAYPGTHFALSRVAAYKGDARMAEREQQLARQGWVRADEAFMTQRLGKR